MPYRPHKPLPKPKVRRPKKRLASPSSQTGTKGNRKQAWARG